MDGERDAKTKYWGISECKLAGGSGGRGTEADVAAAVALWCVQLANAKEERR